MKKKIIKTKKKFSFLGEIKFDVPDYTVLACVRKTKKELEKFLNKDKRYAGIKSHLLKDFGGDKYSGQFSHFNSRFGFLELKEFDFSWRWLDVLNHEVAHLTDFISRDYCFPEESEFKAYLHEGAFRKIRRVFHDSKK